MKRFVKAKIASGNRNLNLNHEKKVADWKIREKEELREKSKIERTKEVANKVKTKRKDKNKKRKFGKSQRRINYKIFQKYEKDTEQIHLSQSHF